MWQRSIELGLLCLACMGTPRSSQADEPLHSQIDKLIAAKANGAAMSGAASDAEFLRRIYLDLAGRIPSLAEARAFLADQAPDKRAKLIDQLPAGPEYPRRMQELAHVLLMERRGDKPEWLAFLKASFEANKPLDQLVREILNPDPKNEATRGSAFFLSKRLEKYGENPVDYPGITRDVGRLFLGIDLQCAQCHDHLFVKDYKQADFQGLFAFFQNTFLRPDVKFPAVGEKVMTQKVEFQSVFKKEKKQIGPRVPGKEEMEVQVFPKGEEYAEPPDAKTKSPGLPKFDPLARLAEQLPTADNPAFTRNMVNRIWFIMMGRGLVHPLDLHHAENPPSHPELLDLLARALAAPHPQPLSPAAGARGDLASSLARATGERGRSDTQALAPAAGERGRGEGAFDVKRLLRELALSETYQRSSRLPDGVDDSPAELSLVAHENYMSAEQLLWSVLQATGSDSASDKPLLPAGTTLDKLRDKFIKAFANPPAEPEGDFTPSLRSSLFLLNGATVLDCLTAQPGNLVDRLSKLSDDAEIADELYLSVLTRKPTPDEQAELADYLAKGGDDRSKSLANFAWALLASTEFCVNH
ncbi:MAG: DUF1549 domain-containing protein [Planctomycetes bacterium]|nr:DUF1549 domain-containing protein [Planctomycetota bacterium]